MNAEDLAEEYDRLNLSFPKKLYFHLGVNAGFFSEFNNMVLAMLYCLDRKIQFVLYSADANFRVDRGWTDFFQPFCPETRDDFHHANNYRWLKIYHPRRKLRLYFMKRQRGLDYLTSDVWRKFKNEGFAAKRFLVPELGIDGGILAATRILHSIAWRYNEGTSASVEAKREAVRLPSNYVGLHLRSGDKFIEHDLYDSSRYIEAAERLGSLREAFVLTDDFSVFERLAADYPGWRFHTTCGPDERGYFHEEFQKRDPDEKADRLVKLFAAMDILADAELFVGTFSSNPGMNMGMRMPEGRAHGVDYDSWRIRW